MMEKKFPSDATLFFRENLELDLDKLIIRFQFDIFKVK